MNITKRIEALERADPGSIVVCNLIGDDWRPLTDDQKAAKLAEAERQAGLGGQVIRIVYVNNWRE